MRHVTRDDMNIIKRLPLLLAHNTPGCVLGKLKYARVVHPMN